MAQLKFVLRNRKKSDLTHPIRLRVTKDGYPSYIPTEYSILPEHWDNGKGEAKKSYSNQIAFNNTLRKFRDVTEDKILEMEKKDKGIHTKGIVEQLNAKPQSFGILDYAKAHLEKFTAPEDENTFQAYNTWMKNLDKYLVGNNLEISKINFEWLEGYEAWLRSPVHTRGKITKSLSDKTVCNQLCFVRTLIKKAIRKGVIEFKDNPFNEYTIHDAEGDKTPLSADDVNALRAVQLDEKKDGFHIYHARNIFIFQYNNMGMRISDVITLKWNQIFKEGIVQYEMNKSGDLMTIDLTDESKRILALYKDRMVSMDAYVFPVYDKVRNGLASTEAKKIKAATTMVNISLKKLEKRAGITTHISTHVARHTWAQGAIDAGASIFQIGNAFGHSTEQTTRKYIRRGFQLPALNKVNKAVANR